MKSFAVWEIVAFGCSQTSCRLLCPVCWDESAEYLPRALPVANNMST